ncbi:methylated-DNA--[protein]-cysteine S-methyltransferase [Marinivivus vitaminiproducens]|uniref:methylated-DNA--[protein]-cysteine S-methyltransferase n=1 Tax=Marinivivus vitaminiproducens TaxID=3035935 RepID=UPI0027A0397C|nr:methylated-DNA--[protein]-cysteine S-methyltransferase [Geminicoccaceae bacterium SCSIO 64248]
MPSLAVDRPDHAADTPAPDWSAAARDYARIEQAIRYIDATYEAQPDLKAIARQIGLSPHHAQRLFRRWAGISPKRFLRFVTAEHARERLRAGQSVLDAALDVGLSGPGRLHDLMVDIEAMTPGEVRRAGAGLTVAWGIHPTPFGEALVLATERGVCGLDFIADPSEADAQLAHARAAWPKARLVADPARTAPLAAQAFALDGPRPRVLLQGSPFQTQVWSAAIRVPPGDLVSYADLARMIGMPRAQQAVGQAMARNKVGFLVPCHRVLRSTGAFSGFAWGRVRRQAMVAWEAARLAADRGDSRA